MQRFKVNYAIIDTKGVVMNKGNLNFTISHYIAVLFKQALSQKAINSVYNCLKNSISLNGQLYFSYLYGTNRYNVTKDRINIVLLMRCIGYYIFNKEISPAPSIIRSHIHKRVFITDGINVMTFHYSKPTGKHLYGYKNNYAMTILPNHSNFSIVTNNTINVLIVDPVNEKWNGRDDLPMDCYQTNLRNLTDEGFCWEFPINFKLTDQKNSKCFVIISTNELNSNECEDVYEMDGVWFGLALRE